MCVTNCFSYLLFIFLCLVKAPEPRTVLEALQQRHGELIKRHQEAVSTGDSSKARRMDRLSKVNSLSLH
jgi:hypothetical protein